jgi:hypothetical protein
VAAVAAWDRLADQPVLAARVVVVQVGNPHRLELLEPQIRAAVAVVQATILWLLAQAAPASSSSSTPYPYSLS